VNVTQEEGKGIIFSSHCSFKRPEPGPIDWQERVDLVGKYEVVLKDVMTPWEMEDANSVLDMARYASLSQVAVAAHLPFAID
jgi:hypothetical protein